MMASWEGQSSDQAATTNREEVERAPGEEGEGAVDPVAVAGQVAEHHVDDLARQTERQSDRAWPRTQYDDWKNHAFVHRLPANALAPTVSHSNQVNESKMTVT